MLLVVLPFVLLVVGWLVPQWWTGGAVFAGGLIVTLTSLDRRVVVEDHDGDWTLHVGALIAVYASVCLLCTLAGTALRRLRDRSVREEVA